MGRLGDEGPPARRPGRLALLPVQRLLDQSARAAAGRETCWRRSGRSACCTTPFPVSSAAGSASPSAIPLLLGIPAALLALALVVQGPIESALGISTEVEFGESIVYPYSSMFPHWLLNSFFGFFSLLVLCRGRGRRGALLAGA